MNFAIRDDAPLPRCKNERFFYGNVPHSIIGIVSPLPGKALATYLAVWDRYLEEIAKIEEVSPNREVVNDCILHIEELVDELELGEGEVKGNFSKGQKKLLYHNDPDSRWYQLCIPEIRFKTVDDAKSCGFKKA